MNALSIICLTRFTDDLLKKKHIVFLTAAHVPTSFCLEEVMDENKISLVYMIPNYRESNKEFIMRLLKRKFNC